jgi:hypothetical protein
MVHTVHLNDEFDVKELPKKTSCGVANFKNRYDKNIALGRYISSEEFRKRAIEKVNKFCNKHGIL